MMETRGGEGVPAPVVRMRKRVKRLDEVEARMIRDLIYSLLIDTFGLSHADASAIMGSRLDRTQVYRRRRELAPYLKKAGAVRLMSEIVEGARHAV